MPKPRLLLIDDDLALLNVLHLALSTHFQVLKADRGEHGLGILTSTEVDAVVTDWCMPGLAGEELLAALTERLPNKPIVVMTGFSDESKAIAAVPYCCAFLRKPISVGRRSSWFIS